jgi:RNA polymerase sigma factor (sigma-70 family)
MKDDFVSKITEFFSLNRSRLVNFVRSRIDDEPSRDAEDIVMDVFSKLLELSDPNVPVEKAVSYLFSAVRNKITDSFRNRLINASVDDYENSVSLEIFNKNEMLNEKQQKHDELYRALESLKPEERAVIVATDFIGISFKELAKEQNVPVGTLLSRKKRAMDKIRKIMNNGGDHD